MIWKCISYAMVGASHLLTGKGCEDVILTSIDEDYAFLILADGAGSATMAAEGAKIATKACLRCLSRLKEDLFIKSERSIKESLLRAIRDGRVSQP